MLCSRSLLRRLAAPLPARPISSSKPRSLPEAHLQSDTSKVHLRASHVKALSPDMPHFIWLPDVLEPASNFRPFFENPSHSVGSLSRRSRSSATCGLWTRATSAIQTTTPVSISTKWLRTLSASWTTTTSRWRRSEDTASAPNSPLSLPSTI